MKTATQNKDIARYARQTATRLWHNWTRTTKTAGSLLWDEWRRPGSRMYVFILSTLFRLVSPVQLPGMFLQAEAADGDPAIYSKDFLSLEDAITFADAY